MLKVVNGVAVEMTSEEITEHRNAIRSGEVRSDVMERSRPLTTSEVTAMLISQQVNSLCVDDNTALRMVEFYPSWESDADYAVGFKVTRNGKLWRVLQAHTSQIGWEPENAASLWEQVCRTYAGTEDDPVPYDGNMRLEAGKYYIQSDVIYLCIRDTVNPVYHDLADLVGQYLEVIT